MTVFIENALVRVGVDEKRGGAICHISKIAIGSHNVINTWDSGRLLQQSYYGSSDGSVWNGKPWKWNPVQGGSWDNSPSQLISIEKVSNNEIQTSCHPRNWGGCQLCTDVIMTTHIKLKDNGDICVTCEMIYSGTNTQGRNVQEIPACFLAAKYSQLIYKNKVTKEITRITPGPPGVKNLQKQADPTWAGYMDPETCEAFIIMSPLATSLTAYRVDIPTNPPESNCSYLAPLLDNCAIRPGVSQKYNFTVRLQKL